MYIVMFVPGPKAGLIRNGAQKVFIEMRGKRISDSVSPLATKVKGQLSHDSSSSKVKDTKITQDKPKLVIVNRENSVFTKQKHGLVDSESSGDNVKEKTKLNKVNTLKQVKKRKIVISSDSETEDLDFGNGESNSMLKKFKSSAKGDDSAKNVNLGNRDQMCSNGIVMATSSTNSASSAVLIDSDSDDELLCNM